VSNAIGNPTAISAKARENQVLSINSTLTSAPSVANPIFRARNGSTTLVDFLLDPTTPFLGGAEDGAAAFNFVSASAVAVGGTQTLPNNYQLIGRDGVVHFSGGFNTATDAITVGQNVSATSMTATAPAS
jgi:hypothetical protein